MKKNVVAMITPDEKPSNAHDILLLQSLVRYTSSKRLAVATLLKRSKKGLDYRNIEN